MMNYYNLYEKLKKEQLGNQEMFSLNVRMPSPAKVTNEVIQYFSYCRMGDFQITKLSSNYQHRQYLKTVVVQNVQEYFSRSCVVVSF